MFYLLFLVIGGAVWTLILRNRREKRNQMHHKF